MYDFLTFPPDGYEASNDLEGPFRRNVLDFISRCGRSVLPPVELAEPPLKTWRVSFRLGVEADGGGPQEVTLDVVEEDVAWSKNVYCDDCRVVGWSGHPVCRKRYHFIIRNENIPISWHLPICPKCRNCLDWSSLRCESCNYEIRSQDLRNWMYLSIEDSTHLLHGMVHANGYGHLLRINGREGGSQILRGSDLMNFWDRLCNLLRVRKVTVMDVSKKQGMVYRLLHGVALGKSWYGNWGYQFGSGSFGATAEGYQKAMDALSSTPLSLLLPNERPSRTQLESTISFYQALSDRPLRTVRDLFRYLVQLHQDSHEQKQSGFRKKEWTEEDVTRAEDAIIKVLGAVSGCRWVSQHCLRRATCRRSVRSPELLDYCLKRIGGKVTAYGTIVAVRCNAGNNAIEYRLEADSTKALPAQYLSRPSSNHLLYDMRFLYDALLDPARMQPYKPHLKWEKSRKAASTLMDCKVFVKHYDMMDRHGGSKRGGVRMYCRIELIDWPKDYTNPPPELLFLPATATIADFKYQVSQAFQETYLILDSFQAEQVLLGDDQGVVDDGTQMSRVLVGWKDRMVGVRGRCNGGGGDICERFRRERGMDEWVVECMCGATDDDGERMLACDICAVWLHTRCSGIGDLDDVPSQFTCWRCNNPSGSESTGSNDTVCWDPHYYLDTSHCSRLYPSPRA